MEPEDRAQQQGTLSPSLESIYASSEQPDMNGLTRGQQLAQTSMILGILSLFVVGVILGPLAISKANKAERQFQTSATVGKVTGWVGTVLGALQIVGFVIWLIFMIGLMSIPAVTKSANTQAGPAVEENVATEPELAASPSSDTSAATGVLRIGISYDHPGLSLAEAGVDPVGFEGDVARFIAESMGYSDSQIEWTSAPSANRETMLTESLVDMVIASYAQTPQREEFVGFAGTYFSGGQGLLVPVESDITSVEDLDGRSLCTTIGSSMGYTIQDEFAPAVELYEVTDLEECLDALGSEADAMVGNDLRLAGLASQSGYAGQFKVVDDVFSQEDFSVGISQSNSMCHDIDAAISRMISSGAWAQALEDNFTDNEFVQRAIANPPTSKSTC